MRVDATLAGLAPTGPSARPTDPAAAGKAFEAWFVGYVVHEMQGAMGGLFGDGAASQLSGLFEEELGRRIAEGPGLGLAEQVAGALARRNGETPAIHGSATHVSGRPDTSTLPPMSHELRVTSAFGARRDPFDGDVRHHAGVDLAAAAGTPVRAARDGIVVSAGARGAYGNVVVLDHGDGVETRYAHCATLAVEPGQVVRAGDAIGTVGATGRATGPHLHFELRDEGRAVDPRRELHDLLGAPAPAATALAETSPAEDRAMPVPVAPAPDDTPSTAGALAAPERP